MRCTTLINQHLRCYLNFSPARFVLITPMVAYADPLQLDQTMATFIMRLMQYPLLDQATIGMALTQSLASLDLPNPDHDPMMDFACDLCIVDAQSDGWRIFTSGRMTLLYVYNDQLCLVIPPADMVSQGLLSSGLSRQNRMAYRHIPTTLSNSKHPALQTTSWQPHIPLWITTDANLVELRNPNELGNPTAWKEDGINTNRVVVELRSSLYPTVHEI